MQPILFWSMATLALGAAFIALIARRPALSVRALVLLMSANSCILFLLSANLLALEVLLVTVGTALFVWILLIKYGGIQHGTPGASRINITKIMAVCAAVTLCVFLVCAITRHYNVEAEMQNACLSARSAFSIAFLLLGNSLATTWVIVIAKKRENNA